MALGIKDGGSSFFIYISMRQQREPLLDASNIKGKM